MKPETEHTIRYIYHKLAHECPELFINSFVAGGAIRDSICNKPVKDIDIFMPTKDYVSPSDETPSSINKWLWANCKIIKEGGSMSDKPHINVWDYEGDTPLPVQFVFDQSSKDYKEALNRFNVSISRVAFLPMENRIVKAKSFTQTLNDRIILYKGKHKRLDEDPYYDQLRKKGFTGTAKEPWHWKRVK